MKRIINNVQFFGCFCIAATQLLGTQIFAQSLLDSAKYQNPVIHADYSDPDAIRVGKDYIMTASSFNHTPGLPILLSKDLVHWKLVGHALSKLIPEDYFSSVRHGGGVWAPAIRYHNHEFYIYYPDPDFGVYQIKAKNYVGPWSAPKLVLAGKGIIDPCPFWDDNGKAYLAHAYAGSRAGIKSIIAIKEMNKEGTAIIKEGKIVYDGHLEDPTIEGPKLYKRNGYYYIFAPGGGVSTGWQTVLRSKQIYGPYERKVVMSQGSTNINGPHQGAWVNAVDGKDWFLHFQDKDAYGRIVHLQPMIWKSDWPVIGEDINHNGNGQPVYNFKKPTAGSSFEQMNTIIDDFKEDHLSLDWQWQANANIDWLFLNKGTLRLYAKPYNDSLGNLYNVPNLLMRKFEAESFSATTLLNFSPLKNNDQCGLMIFGYDYAWIGLQKKDSTVFLVQSVCKHADQGKEEQQEILTPVKLGQKVFLHVDVTKDATCTFSYSFDGKNYTLAPQKFTAKQGKWVGAKIGLFAHAFNKTNDCGYADFDWFEIKK